MQTLDTLTLANPNSSSAVKAVRKVLRHRLAGRRGLIVLGLGIVVASLALGWSWLTAIGVAPIILSLAPCAAMCVLGLCVNKAACQSGTKPQGAAPKADVDPK